MVPKIYRDLSALGWCIASLYIYHCLTVIDFSSKKSTTVERSTVVLLDTGTPGTSREIFE